MPFKWYALISLMFIAATIACVNDDDCSLNGICSQNICQCDPWWKGEDCGILNILPATKQSGYNRLAKEDISSWGGSIVHDPDDPKLWHLIASEFVNKCPLNNWVPNSHIIRAESVTGPFGPYKFKQEILPTFHHNPTVTRTNDGTFLMYTIGSQYNKVFDCSDGSRHPGWPGWPLESGLNLFKARSLDSWTKVGIVLSNNSMGKWDTDTTNPSAFALTNGTVILMYRGCKEGCESAELIGISRADKWMGPYERLSKDPLFKNPNEDPYIWQDSRGYWHTLLHSLEPHGGFGGPNVGRHAFSRDGINWTFGSQHLAYNVTVEWKDGTKTDFHRRERPSLYFEGGKPLLLINGVQEKGHSGSYTIMVPLAQ